MRSTFLPPLALLLALLPQAARADVVVDPLQRGVETGQFHVRFDADNPERVVELVWKPWSATQNLAAQNFGDLHEYFGQSLGELSGPALFEPTLPVEFDWNAEVQSAERASVTTITRSEGGPRLTSHYTFVADEPWFLVERTIDFSLAPRSTSFQPFVPRLGAIGPYRTTRWRDSLGVVRLSGFCFAGCLNPDWDGTWIETEQRVGASPVSIALLSLGGNPFTSEFVRGKGPNAGGSWAAPRYGSPVASQPTYRYAIAFSLTPDDIARLDSLRAMFAAAAATPPPRALERLALSVSPTLTRGEVRVRLSLERAGHVVIDVVDLAGRHVASLTDAQLPAGTHEALWTAHVRAGLYFVHARAGAEQVAQRVIVFR